MMIFLSVLFFTTSLLTLFKGPMFSETGKKLKLIGIAEEEKKRAGDTFKSDAVENFVKTGCAPLIVALILTVVEIAYLIVAIEHDPYKIPTLLAILFLALAFVTSSLKKKTVNMSDSELMLEKSKALSTKNVSISSAVKSLIWLSYFSYMIYVLVF